MISQTTLTENLEALGVREGMLLMVHAGLRKVGPINGGANTLIDVILKILGPDGTLLMVLGADDSEPFDPLTTPSEPEIGVLAEVFRQRPGIRVNDHAAARYGACGSRAVELLDSLSLHHYHGPGSVMSKFTEMEGTVLRLGANVDTVTLTHWAEYLAQIPNKRRVRLRYVRADIGEQWIESLDDTDGIVDWEQGDYFSQILKDFLEAGQARMGNVGNCTAELFSAKVFVEFATEWMEMNL